MSSDFPTLTTGPLPHPAMDYAALRAEGLSLLGELTGGQWTDFNVHDPGITILEQLCYAITDLGYRANFPMADLLAGSANPGLPGPHQILTGEPVTTTDLHKRALDLGVSAAQVEEVSTSELPFYYHPGSGELRLVADPAATDPRPVSLRGVTGVLVRTTDALSGDAALAAVAESVHAGRLVGEDLQVGLLGTWTVWVAAEIEVGPVDDPVSLLADIVETIQAYLAPPARFYTNAELAETPNAEKYEGPLLNHGFLREIPQTRQTLYGSDLIHALTDLPPVRAVRSLGFASSSGGKREPWIMQVPAGSVAQLATDSPIKLLRAGLPLRVNKDALQACLDARARARESALVAQTPPEAPPVRSRDLARTRSLQRQLPAAYGLAPLGLPDSASAERKAQALQLQAYLLIFDQLLANGLAQLANAHALLSPDEGGTRSYFAQPVVDAPIDLSGLLRLSPEAYAAWLDDAIEPGDPLERRKRFLSHLLARFAEELGDHARVGADADSAPDAEIVAERQAFLLDIVRASCARGSGYNLLDGAMGGLEARLGHKLGSGDSRRFLLIEHILLRPVPEDRGQLVDEGEEQIPLLAGVSGPDPWSLRVSFVFRDQEDSEEFRVFEQFVAQTLLAEVPAHLSPQLHWFGVADGVDHGAQIEAAWLDFRTKLRVYRIARLGGAAATDEVQLQLRDARDRVIDLLQLGRTWPLRDIPFSDRLIVAPGSATEVVLGFSQAGVRYELRHEGSGEPILLDGEPIVAEGTGGELRLPTPPIVDDISYRILAVKLEGADQPELRRATWLRGSTRVEEGVDPRLVAQIVGLSLLDASQDEAAPTDARIADYGVEVRVELLESQEGVTYELIDDAQAELAFDAQTPVSAAVVGTSGTIVLSYPVATEDLDLRLRGSKSVGDPQNPELRTATLDIVLPLRVRAKRSAEAAVPTPIVAYGGASTLEVRTTQRSVSYQVWERAVRDSEFNFEASPSQPVVEVSDEGRVIRLNRPPTTAALSAEGFTSRGDAKVGNAQKITFQLGNFTADTSLLILASKQHRLRALRSADTSTVGSTVQLDRALAQLVRPNPAAPLRVQVLIVGQLTSGPWCFLDGQAGVYYSVYNADKIIGLPAYFHQRDDRDARQNKGLGQLGVEIDLALATDAPLTDARASQAPPPPSVDERDMPVGTRLTVRARKAMSGIEGSLTAPLLLTTPAAVRAEPARVEAGASAQIVVTSLVGERYTLTRGGVAIGASQAGTGGELRFETGAIAASTTFEVWMAGSQAVLLERRVQVTVEV